MKDARDIRLLGIGFVAGMVLCYFLTLDEPAPTATGTITLAQSKQLRPFGEAKEADLEWTRWIEMSQPKPNDGHPRIVPARLENFYRIAPAWPINGQYPRRAPVAYDLID